MVRGKVTLLVACHDEGFLRDVGVERRVRPNQGAAGQT